MQRGEENEMMFCDDVFLECAFCVGVCVRGETDRE
jgi:hypothetical protein